MGLISVLGGWAPRIAIGQPVVLDVQSGKDDKAIVTDVGFGRGKVSVITHSNEDIKITEVETANVTPIFSSSLSLTGAVGRNVETSSLFEAITSLKNQAYSGSVMPDMETESPKELFFSPNLLLVMLLKVTLRLPNFRGGQSDGITSLLQALV